MSTKFIYSPRVVLYKVLGQTLMHLRYIGNKRIDLKYGRVSNKRTIDIQQLQKINAITKLNWPVSAKRC